MKNIQNKNLGKMQDSMEPELKTTKCLRVLFAQKEWTLKLR